MEGNGGLPLNQIKTSTHKTPVKVTTVLKDGSCFEFRVFPVKLNLSKEFNFVMIANIYCPYIIKLLQQNYQKPFLECSKCDIAEICSGSR